MAATPYLTPRRFALGGFGIDTSGISAPALRATLRRASTIVNTWCNGSMLPQPFDFRGGTVTGELHRFPIPSPLVAYPGSRRVFVRQRPLLTVTAFAIRFTSNYRIDLTLPNDVFVNTDEGWCEIVASQPTIVGFPPIGYWYGLYQPVAEVSYTYGYQIAVADDECEASSPTTYFATYGMWDASAVTVKVDGTEKTISTDYTVNRDDGSITFVAAEVPAPGEVVTCSYVTTLPDAIAQATGLVATGLIGTSRMAQRGMVGLKSLRVAEVALTRDDSGVTRNGVSIPSEAAALLGSFALGSAA